MRSFKRGMDPQEEGWEKVSGESVNEGEEISIEEALRANFEKVLKVALDEMKRQIDAGICEPVKAFGELTGKTGQSFRILLECEPPKRRIISTKIIPRLN